MVISTKTLRVDISNNQEHIYLKSKQYDTQSRKYRLIITDKNIPLPLIGNEYVVCGMYRSNGTYADTVCEWENGYLYLTMSDAMLSKSGDAKLEIRIYDFQNGTSISTMTMNINIQPSVLPYDRVMTSEEFNLLHNFILSVQSATIHAEEINALLPQLKLDAAEIESILSKGPLLVANLETAVDKEKARMTDEDIRIANENERIANEALRSASETKRLIAENTRISSEMERVNAESSRKEAEDFRNELFDTSIRECQKTTEIVSELASEYKEASQSINEVTGKFQELINYVNENDIEENIMASERYAKEAKRYAVGGVIKEDEKDNAKFYYEQTSNLADRVEVTSQLNLPKLTLDLDTMHLMATYGSLFSFSIVNGHLISEVKSE